jgi:hypothetical protein
MPAQELNLPHILRRQLDPSIKMLQDLIDVCPDQVWTSSGDGRPFWQQIMHALISVQFWFREADEAFRPPDLGQGPVPDLDVEPGFSVSKESVKDYLSVIVRRIDAFFLRLSEEKLTSPSSIYNKVSYADIAVGQIRHLQHHVGYCNAILHLRDLKAVAWREHAE